MQRLVFFSLLAVACYAEISNDELSKYGSEIFNDCTKCNLLNAARKQPDLLNEIALGIAALPEPYRTHAMMVIKDWTVKVATTPVTDCTPTCRMLSNATTSACQSLQFVSEHLAEQMQSLQEEEIKACKGKKGCLEQVEMNSELMVAGLKEIVHLLATYVDPQSACGSAEVEANGFLKCKICSVLFKFIYSTIVGGNTDTSKAIIGGIGNLGTKACVYLKMEKILSFLKPFIGKNSICDEVPGLVNLLFKYVLGPIFGSKSKQVCGLLLGGC